MTNSPKKLFAKMKEGISKNPGQMIAATFSFWIMVLVAIAPCLLSPLFLVLTVPFIFAPALFVYVATAGGLSQDPEFAISNKTTWGLFLSYFSVPYRGAFKMWLGFLKAMLAFFGVMLVVSALMSGLAPVIWPDFNDTINNFYSLLESGSANEIFHFMQESDTLIQYTTLSSSIVFGGAFVMFLHHCLVYGLNCYSRLLFPKAGRNFSDTIFRQTLRSERASFSKAYYGTMWPIYLLLIIGYAGGVALGVYFQWDLVYVLAVSMALSITLALLYFPFYGVGIACIADDIRPATLRMSTRMAQQSLDQLRAMQSLSQEEIESLENMLRGFNEKIPPEDESPKDDEHKDE